MQILILGCARALPQLGPRPARRTLQCEWFGLLPRGSLGHITVELGTDALAVSSSWSGESVNCPTQGMDEPAPLVVSPAAIHEGVYGEERERVEMFRAAFSEEPRVASIDRRATDADLIHLIDGASIAINDLLHMYMQAGNIPRVLSERRCVQPRHPDHP